MKTHTCTVLQKTHPRPDCTSIEFLPSDPDAFVGHPGQHVVVRLPIAGQTVARCYSLHDGPFSGRPWAFTARRIEGGAMSSTLYDHVQPGMQLECSAPSGRFVVEPKPDAYHHYYFYAAGTGITPILAMLQGVLFHEPHSFVTLLYGNRRAATTLFRTRIHGLMSQYEDRFSLRELFSDDRGSWRGRINDSSVKALLAEHQPRAQQVRHYICGPAGMDEAVRTTLLSLGAAPDSVHVERFGGAPAPSTTVAAAATPAASLTVVPAQGPAAHVQLASGQTLLAGMRAHGVNAPSSCESGVCGSCTAALTKGSVQMRSTVALSEQDIREGLVLPCQAVATSPTLELSYAALRRRP